MDPRDAATVPDAEVGDDRGPLRSAHLGHFALGDQLGAGGMGVVFRATDTLLDRPVALKVLHPKTARTAAARARLLREAQALARLTHPNVVAVYEVGSAGDELFVAMELVVGTTLREWMGTPRPWREVVAMFVAIGRGLAAVHALGLVHRDIKPSNVLVDRAGVPKVGDFGLVDHADDATDPGPTTPRTDDDLTSVGAVLGTPAYMAPEQRLGRTTARSDQYSFAIALVEALTGVIPIDGAVDAVPRPLRSIVRRALAADPARRYPTVDAMLTALDRATHRARRMWIAGGAAALLASAAASALALAPSPAPPEPCPPPDAQPLWGEARQRALASHLAAIDPAHGADRLAVAGAVIAPVVAAWRDMTVLACTATRVRGTQSDAALDRRMTCLDQRRAALDAAIAELATATTPATLDAAIAGLHHLAPIDDCADADALARVTGPALAGDQRVAAAAIADRLVQLRADSRAGRHDGLRARALAVVVDARRLGHPATELAALQVLAEVQLWAGDTDGGTTTLRTITQRAAALRDDRVEASAWIKLIALLGVDLGQADEALALVPAAEAAVLRAGRPTDLTADLLLSHAQVIDAGPDRAHGIAMLEDAARMLREAAGREPSSRDDARQADVLLELGIARGLDGDADRGAEAIQAAIARWQQLDGPDSPDEAYGWQNLGALQQQAGRLDAAGTSFARAVAIRLARLGPSPSLAASLTGLASVYNDQRDYPRALVTYTRAVELLRTLTAPDDPTQLGAQMGRAMVLRHLGRVDDAQAAYDAAIAAVQRSGAETVDLGLALYNRAELATARGRCDAAIADYQRAAAILEAQRGADSPGVRRSLLGVGRCQVRGRAAAAAIAPLARAIALAPDPAAPRLHDLLARAWLGRALVESGRDRRRGLALAKDARAPLAAAADPDGVVELRELDAWLAKH